VHALSIELVRIEPIKNNRLVFSHCKGNVLIANSLLKAVTNGDKKRDKKDMGEPNNQRYLFGL